MEQLEPKPAGTWDYRGACSPNFGSFYRHQETFSLGVFQWQARSGRKGTKPGKVVKRFTGQCADPGPAYAAAQDYCSRMNAATGGKE